MKYRFEGEVRVQVVTEVEAEDPKQAYDRAIQRMVYLRRQSPEDAYWTPDQPDAVVDHVEVTKVEQKDEA